MRARIPHLSTLQRCWNHIDIALAGGVAITTLAVRDLRQIYCVPFWGDEAWVADSTKVAIGKLPWITSSTPIGWTFLLRLVPRIGSAERLRLVPLVFSVATALAAFVFGRVLFGRERHLATLLSLAVLIAPISLAFVYLKQYTADAFFAVLVIGLMASLEDAWSTQRLIVLGGFVSVALFFSHAAVFVAAAVYGCLFVRQLQQHSWRRAGAVVSVGTMTVIVGGLLYVFVIHPDLNYQLKHFWDAYYLSTYHGPALASFVLGRWRSVAHLSGLGSPVALLIGVAVSTFGLVRRGFVALAMIPWSLVAISSVVGALRLYPYLDDRTSTFLTTTLVLFATVGIAYVISWITAVTRPVAGSSVRGPLVSLTLIAVVLVVLVRAALPFLPARVKPIEDVRDQIRWVEAYKRPGDVVLVNFPSNWGFAYYSHVRGLRFVRTSIISTGFIAVVPPTSDFLLMDSRSPAGIAAALSRARSRQALHPGATLWVIRTHMNAVEQQGWDRALKGVPARRLVFDGDSLLVVPPALGRSLRSRP